MPEGGIGPPLARGRRLLRLGCLLSLVAFLVLQAGTPALAGGSSDFQVLTTGAAEQLSAAQNPPNFGPFADGIVDATLGYVAGDFESGGDSSGQSAAFYPGNLVAQGPALFCSEVVPDIPGASCPNQLADFTYPLLAQASYPTAPSASAPAGDQSLGGGIFPVSATPGRSQAQASATGDSSQTAVIDAAGLTGTPVAVTVGSASSLEQIRTAGSEAQATVITSLSDITIGGILHIGSLRSVDTVIVSTTGVLKDSPSTRIADATVAGQQATIDSSGVHVAGHNGPALVHRLSAQGITVTLASATRSDQAGVARSTTAGIEVDFAEPLNTGQQPPPLPQPVPSICANDLGFPCGVPDPNATYSGALLLGQAGIAASAEPGINLSLNFPLPSAGAAATSLPGTAGAAGSNVSASVTGGSSSLVTPPPSGSAPAVGAGRGGARSLLAQLSRLRLQSLYAVLALGAIVLLAAWRATAALSWRRPR